MNGDGIIRNAMSESVVKKRLGERIRELRLKAGLSQEELGKLLGVKKAAVSMWERGQNRPPIDKIFKMAKIFGVRPSDIMPKLEGDEVELIELPKPVKIIPIYSLPVSAGNGMFPDEIYILDKLPVHRVDVDFAVKVDGDSMEPVVPDGAIILVKENPEAKDGDMILCTYDGHVFVKWFHKDDGEIYLVSENQQYAPIRVDPKEGFIIHGVVMGVIYERPKKRFK